MSWFWDFGFLGPQEGEKAAVEVVGFLASGFGFIGVDLSRGSSELTDGLPMESLDDQGLDSDRSEVWRIGMLVLYWLMTTSVLSVSWETETSCRKSG